MQSKSWHFMSYIKWFIKGLDNEVQKLQITSASSSLWGHGNNASILWSGVGIFIQNRKSESNRHQVIEKRC